MNEHSSDFGVHVRNALGNKIASYDFPYLIVPGFRRQDENTFLILSALTEDNTAYDLTVVIAKDLCMRIPPLIENPVVAEQIRTYFELPFDPNEEVPSDFLFDEQITLAVKTQLGEEELFDGEQVLIPFIATEVSKSPARF